MGGDAQGSAARCDGIDGVMDGTIDTPDQCDYAPEALLCNDTVKGQNKSLCLTAHQPEVVTRVFSRLHGGKGGELLIPHYDPGTTFLGGGCVRIGRRKLERFIMRRGVGTSHHETSRKQDISSWISGSGRSGLWRWLYMESLYGVRAIQSI